jgi:hypothetical protein
MMVSTLDRSVAVCEAVWRSYRNSAYRSPCEPLYYRSWQSNRYTDPDR